MSSSRAGRPWTKGKGSGGGRPLTRGRQRGYYSEVVGAEAVQRLGVSDEVRSWLVVKLVQFWLMYLIQYRQKIIQFSLIISRFSLSLSEREARSQVSPQHCVEVSKR